RLGRVGQVGFGDEPQAALTIGAATCHVSCPPLRERVMWPPSATTGSRRTIRRRWTRCPPPRPRRPVRRSPRRPGPRRRAASRTGGSGPTGCGGSGGASRRGQLPPCSRGLLGRRGEEEPDARVGDEQRWSGGVVVAHQPVADVPLRRPPLGGGREVEVSPAVEQHPPDGVLDSLRLL